MAVIAVVEDEQAIARLISLHLQSAGYEPKLYETGDEFLRSLRGDVPDLVLLDWMLPGENDGIAVLKALRANEKTRAVPVIMLTAKAEELDRILGLEVGADFDGEARTVDMHMTNLRRKLDEAGAKDYIQTVRAVGYKMCTL